MKLGEIIKKYRTEHRESMGDFATKTGLSKTYISMLEKNLNTSTGKPVIPSIPTLTKCAIAMNLTLDELIPLLDPDQIIDLTATTTKIIQSKVDEIQAPKPTYPNVTPATYRKFKVIGNIACGSPIEAIESSSEYEYVQTDLNIHADYVLRAQGDSMVNARIFNGDFVFIREQPEVENGEIAAVWMDGEVTLKRFYKHDEYIELRAENPMYKPIIIHESDFDTIKVIGKAVACQFFVI